MSARPLPCIVTLALALSAADCLAIEMFTFYGDGSRIGLPSLEVPVEAYPGIPLRSDRIRARRRGRMTAARSGRGSVPATVTLREVPAPVAPEPPPVQAPR